MKIFGIFLLLTFGCYAVDLPIESKSCLYQGVKYDNPELFVANYIADSVSGYYLSAPIVFKLSTNRDTMFIYCNGTGKVAVKDDCKSYVIKTPEKVVIYQIKKNHVTVLIDGHLYKILNKSMI